MRLAEAMEARGYGSAPPLPRLPRFVGALSAPLLLAAASLWFYYDNLKLYAAIAGAAGFVALLFWWFSVARMRHTSVLHNEPISAKDTALAIASLSTALFAIAGGPGGWLHTGYNPFAGLPWPRFSAAGALLMLACAWPAVRLLFETPAVIDETEGSTPSPAALPVAADPQRAERAT